MRHGSDPPLHRLVLVSHVIGALVTRRNACSNAGYLRALMAGPFAVHWAMELTHDAWFRDPPGDKHYESERCQH